MTKLGDIYILLTLLVVFVPQVISQEISCRDLASFNRNTFPPCFTFGVATSAFQVEGATNGGGRGPSIWDTFLQKNKDKINDISKGRMADSYHRYKEDVGLMKEMGVDSYRFSISWSRVLPKGSRKEGVNEEGINYYNNVLNELHRNGIKPSVTMFHWDVPQALEDKYGGFLSPKIVDDFRDYADLCFERFGDRVKYWTTINEPQTFTSQGYATGVFAPGHCSNRTLCSTGNAGTEPYLASHYILLAHAAAVKLYREKYQLCQGGNIGIVLSSGWMEPLTDSVADKQAAERQIDFNLGWYLNPMTYGDYPKSMRDLVKDRLPKFTQLESKMLTKSFDFIGLNYYYAVYAFDASKSPPPTEFDYNSDPRVNTTSKRNGKDIGEQAASSWLYIYPKGIYDMLMYIKEKYDNPIIIIMESGVDEANNEKLSIQQATVDNKRIEFYQDHLCFLLKAINEGCYVRGFYAWSLLDNLEWAAAETVRFGLHFVDFVNGSERYPKESAKWFKKFLRTDRRSVLGVCNDPR